MAVFEQKLKQVGFIENLLNDIAKVTRSTTVPIPIDVANMSIHEVIERAIDAILDFVPTQGVSREHIDFNFATECEIKKWLVTNYSLFYFNSKD